MAFARRRHARQALLEKTLGNMALPPDDWADEVKDLHAQLVECLEQLLAREKELNEGDLLVRHYEGSLVTMRQQMAALYKEHIQYCKDAEEDKRAARGAGSGEAGGSRESRPAGGAP